MKHGRPLRFLALTMGGWTAIRVALLWPMIDSVPALIKAIAPPVAAATRPQAIPVIAPEPRQVMTLPASTEHVPSPPAHRIAAIGAVSVNNAAAIVVDRAAPDLPAPIQPPPLRPVSLASPPGRLAGSAWGIVRGGAADTLTCGQLGGSQVGARLTYALGTARRVALAARVSAPLSGQGAELGLGIDWQPGAMPFHLIAEHRIALDGGRGGPTVMIVGGVDAKPLAAGFRLDAYGQAGAIARDGVERFADGAARITHPLARSGATRVDLGAGVWGGAQRGVTRLDLWPSIALTLPVERRAVRLTLDWRQRVAGNAHPGSGPALSIGGDF